MKKVFIGSSKEQEKLANEVASWLTNLNVEPILWNNPTTFKTTGYTWSELHRIAHEVDGAVFIFAPDDKTWYRGKKAGSVRQNVILEFGLFSGCLSEKCVCFIRSDNTRLPSDLSGITYCDISNQYSARIKLTEWVNDTLPIIEHSNNLNDPILKMATEQHITQETIIDNLLFQFCELIKQKANLSKPIEAVTVIFCRNNSKRMTFYSCNKTYGQDKHRERNITDGVVGLLIERFEESGGDIIVYYDQKMGDTYQIKKYNRNEAEFTKKWEESHGEKQSWTNNDTNSMFAIPFLVSDKLNNNKIYGALTFDLCDSLYNSNNEKDVEKIEDICKGIVATRDAVKYLLTDNIVTDFLNFGVRLECLEKTTRRKNRKGKKE